MTDRNTISQVVESLFEDWIDKNINVHPLAVENMRILEADAIAMLKKQEVETERLKKPSDSMRDEDEMDMLEIAIQNDLERFHIIPEQTGADDLLIDIYTTMFEYMKELRKRLLT